MNLAMAGGGQYTVPPEPNRGPAFLLAAVVHAALLGALWVGVNWQSSAPVAVEAEVWDIKTEMAAAPPVEAPEPEPEPQQPPKAVDRPVESPTPPDIALERKKKEELKKKELEEKKLAEKKAKEEADKKAKKLAAEKAALEKSRQENLKRMLGATGVAGSAAKSTAPRNSSGYIAKLTAKIKANIIYAGNRDVPGDPRATYRIEQLPTGEILGFKQIKSSGIPEYDRAVEQAIRASSPLPRDTDGTVARTIEPEFRLKE
jgi:colicin import membrane protein